MTLNPPPISSRAGLTAICGGLRFSPIRLFGSLRQSGKGQPIPEIFKQLFCFFLDGTSRHLVYFDALKQDEGYAGALETGSKALPRMRSRFSGGFYMKAAAVPVAAAAGALILLGLEPWRWTTMRPRSATARRPPTNG